ncbi:MAG TPA: TetR family transcriptional regulator [Trueperaceae bacterium]|nr:TetR family transcriptional regulator [Trueperaceae bacterium]
MCSVPSGDRQGGEKDLTAKARIRNAAIEQFGRHGVAKTSIRSVAVAARVSPALVIHHFSSKDGLKRACDRHVIDELMGKSEDLRGADLVSTMRHWLDDLDTFRPAFDYLARLLVEDASAGDALFDGLVGSTEKLLVDGIARGEMQQTTDVRMMAVLIAAYGLVPLILERHLGRALGTPGLDGAAVARMTIPALELFTHGLYTNSDYLDAAKAALKKG